MTQATDGVVRLRLTPGSYVVTGAITTGYTLVKPKCEAFPVDVGKTNRVTVAVRAHENKGDAATAKSVACATGIACDSQGKPIPKAKVQVLSLIGGIIELTADDDGRFSIPAANVGVPACLVLVRHPNKELVALGVATMDETTRDQEDLTVPDTFVLGTRPRRIILRSPISVSGVVYDPRGAPIRGATVTAQVDGSHMGRSAVFLTTTSDQAGRYCLKLAGSTVPSYALVAKAPGHSDSEVVVDPSDLFAGGTKVAKLVLHPANRTVQGIVLDKTNRPVPGTVITATRMASLKYPGCVVSDAQGRFVLECLDDADTIYLFAHVPGRGWVEQGATIHPGEKEVVIRVEPCHWE